MTYDEIRERLLQFPERQFIGGVDEMTILSAQAQFDGAFPADLFDYLRNLGAGHVGSEEFIGLGGPRYLDVVRVAHCLREPSTYAQFSRYMVPIRHDGFGNYDCVDLSASMDVCSLVLAWQHDARDQATGALPIIGLWAWFDQILDIVDEDG